MRQQAISQVCQIGSASLCILCTPAEQLRFAASSCFVLAKIGSKRAVACLSKSAVLCSDVQDAESAGPNLMKQSQGLPGGAAFALLDAQSMAAKVGPTVGCLRARPSASLVRLR